MQRVASKMQSVANEKANLVGPTKKLDQREEDKLVKECNEGIYIIKI